jgi:hypothetical protein
MARPITIAALLIGVYCIAWASAGCIRNDTLPLRLPTSIIPSKYYLALSPNLDANTFAGTITITANVFAQTSCVILHAKGLEVSSVIASSGNNQLTGSVSYEPSKEWIVADFGTDLSVGSEYSIEVLFAFEFCC